MGRIEAAAYEAECLAAVAEEQGLLISESDSFAEHLSNPSGWVGTEHVVEVDVANQRVDKLTRPPAFGLIGSLVSREVYDFESRGTVLKTVFDIVDATPLEYLERWQVNNDVFGDEVRLERVIRWVDGQFSFLISQPQYHGRIAEVREIEHYFKRGGWELISSPEHVLYYEPNADVIAIDAAPRNCYLTDLGLQPFDVILQRPTIEIREFLQLPSSVSS